MSRGLFYADGFFPFAVPEGEEWDGSTYVGVNPSKSAEEFGDRTNLFVVGPGSHYPVGFSLFAMDQIFWKVKSLSVGTDWLLRTETHSGGPDVVLNLRGEIPSTEFPAGYVQDKYFPNEFGDIETLKVYGLSNDYETGLVVPGLIGEKPTSDYVFLERGMQDDDEKRRSLVCGNSCRHKAFGWNGVPSAWEENGEFFSMFQHDSIPPAKLPEILKVGDLYYPRLFITTLSYERSWYTGDPVPSFLDATLGGNIFSAQSLRGDPTGDTPWQERGEIPCTFFGETIPLFSRPLLVEEPVIESVSGVVAITPVKYWTYGGVYDEDTGEPV